MVEPIAPARWKVQFTASGELRDKLDRLRVLMRSSIPDGDIEAIIEEAVTEKLERLEAKRFGATKAQSLGSAANAHRSRVKLERRKAHPSSDRQRGQIRSQRPRATRPSFTKRQRSHQNKDGSSLSLTILLV